MKILVLGVGGIGGFFGGFLQESGADVTFLVRPKRKALLIKNKLKIISQIGNLNLEPNLILSNELKPVYDVVLVSCKTCLLYTSPSPRDEQSSRMPSSA